MFNKVCFRKKIDDVVYLKFKNIFIEFIKYFYCENLDKMFLENIFKNILDKNF